MLHTILSDIKTDQCPNPHSRFRKYLNLKEYDNFEEWCEDADTARAAELLYGHIDNLELYPGLMAECTKPPMPGSGVCPGQTTGRGILDDAVALVRGDRFLSYDLTSNTLTNWGVGKIATYPQGSYGGMLPHMIFNGLPGGFNGTSPYALLPFYTPKAVQGILRDNKAIAKYDIARPPDDMTVVGIHTQAGCKAALEDRDNLRTIYNSAIANTTEGNETFVGWDESNKHDAKSEQLMKIFFEDGFEDHVKGFFTQKIQELIKTSSLKYPTTRRAIDIVQNVTNVVPLLWIAERFAIPLKTIQQPRGIISVAELFAAYVPLYQYQNFNLIPAQEWTLRAKAQKAGSTLGDIFEAHLKTQSGIKESVVDWLAKGSAFEVGAEADRIYHALNATKQSVEESVADILVLTAPAAANLTTQASLLIDLYLSEEYGLSRARIAELAQKDDAASFEELQGFVMEGMRHACAVPGVPRVAAKAFTIQDGSRGPVQIKAQQKVLIATSKAGMDPEAFPDPEKIDPTRPISSYSVLGYGMHHCFGWRLVTTALTVTLKEVFKLKNLRRAQGRAGMFIQTQRELAGVSIRSYLDANALEQIVPTTLVLNYDE